MRTFGQVPIRIWRDRKFRALGDDAKLAFVSLWCGPDSTSAGVMRLEDGYAALTLDWPVARWASARAELEAQGLILRDAETDEILIPGFFAVNRPANDRARAAVVKLIQAIESELLHTEALRAFEAIAPLRQDTVSRLQTPYLNGARR
jgi:hypothetical protein